jgi:hypothetical protein
MTALSASTNYWRSIAASQRRSSASSSTMTSSSDWGRLEGGRHGASIVNARCSLTDNGFLSGVRKYSSGTRIEIRAKLSCSNCVRKVFGVPTGIRTPVLTVKGWCPRPLDDGDYRSTYGGARRDRTADLLHAMQALSQLSYGPTKGSGTLHDGV